MILGLGTDLLSITRIEKTLQKFGVRFLDRIYTENEKMRASSRPKPANMLAMCYAAKEACSKALGTGLRQGVFWRDMAVIHLPSGKPTMKLSGGALARLHSLTPEGMQAHVEVTLTDEADLAQAVVIIWADSSASEKLPIMK